LSAPYKERTNLTYLSEMNHGGAFLINILSRSTAKDRCTGNKYTDIRLISTVGSTYDSQSEGPTLNFGDVYVYASASRSCQCGFLCAIVRWIGH